MKIIVIIFLLGFGIYLNGCGQNSGSGSYNSGGSGGSSSRYFDAALSFGVISFEASFVYDVYTSSNIKIAIGGNVGDFKNAGQYYVQDGSTDPKEVTAAAGKVTYKLYSDVSKTFSAGLLIVQMLDDNRIKIDRTSQSVDSMDFSSNAKTYYR